VTMKNSTHLTKKKLTVHLGEMLKEARLKAELTQVDVADRVGVATEVYGRMERGDLTPSVPSLRRLCVVLFSSRRSTRWRTTLSSRSTSAWRGRGQWLEAHAALPWHERPPRRSMPQPRRTAPSRQAH
jgi:transcriptional regulator with XRE-family HTH domain